MRGRFGDLITAMVTPFDGKGKVNLKEAARLASHLADHGSDGFVLAGSTGEGPTVTDEEKIQLIEAVKEAVGDRASIIANTGTYDTAHSIHLTKQAEKVGADAVLVVTPYYNRPPQNGLLSHFRAIAESTKLPLILYDIPARSARKIEHETLVELSGVENIAAVKDACGDVQGAARLVADSAEGFEVYSGNDGDTLPWLSVGAVGVIAVASHVVGPQMAEMISLFKSGDAEGARKIHLDLMPVFDMLGALTTNPIPVKAALVEMGFDVGEPRLPLVPATPGQLKVIREILKKAGAL